MTDFLDAGDEVLLYNMCKSIGIDKAYHCKEYFWIMKIKIG